jgi:hypothetical protein
MIVGCVCADSVPITAAVKKHIASLADLLVIGNTPPTDFFWEAVSAASQGHDFFL